MAIIQISKIQVRSGNIVDLPQLDEGEFGWASDDKRLFIGKEDPHENVEILTGYSEISFSQIEGAVGNLNINPSTLANGQVLAFTGTEWVNKGGDAGGLITLGDVGNVKIEGGSIGYVLETDGLGNLSWTPKGTITAYVLNATKTNPVVVTTTEDNFFTQAAEVTITGVPGMTQLNGNSFYANVLSSNSFSLYSDPLLTTPVNGTAYGLFPNTTATATDSVTDTVTVGDSSAFALNSPVKFIGTTFGGIAENVTYYVKTKPTGTSLTLSLLPGGVTVELTTATGSCKVYGTGGRVISSVGGVGVIPAAGSNTMVQYNNNGLLDGTTNFRYDNSNNTVVITGTANIANLNVSNAISAPQFMSTVANGTPPLTANSSTLVANLNADLLDGYNSSIPAVASTVVVRDSNGNVNANTVTANLLTGTLTTAAQPNVTSLGTLTGLTVNGNISAGNITSNGVFTGNGYNLTNLNPGNITGNVANADFATNANYAAYAGNVTIAAQPNITSLGTLTGLAVNGNITAANITANTGVFTGNGSGLSAINASNITTGTLDQARLANASITINGTIVTLGGSFSLSSNTSGTLTLGSYLTGGSFNGSANITATVDATPTNQALKVVARDANGSFSANIITATLHGTANNTATVTASAQPNITSVGNLTHLSVGNNLVYANIVDGNVTVTGIFTGNGSGLTTLNASNITTGTLNQARLANSSITINGTSVSLGGSATIGAATTQALTLGNYLTGISFNGSAAVTANVDATTTATANKVVARDGNANIYGNNIFGVIRPTSGTGTNGIIFPADPGGGSGDLATIKYYAVTGESTLLELAVTNDADDKINLSVPSNNGVMVNNNVVWNAGNDGANSGLDADLIDGEHLANFAPVGLEGQVSFLANNSTYARENDFTLIEGYFIDTNAELTEAQNALTDYAVIFNTWTRFSLDSSPAQPAIPSELLAWSFNPSTGVIESTINSSSYIGFVSPDSYSNYTLKVQLKSANADNDTIGVVVGWYVDPVTGRQNTLSALRDTGGTIGGWQIWYNYLQSDQQLLLNGNSTVTATGGWSSYPNGVTIEVVRTNNSLTFVTTQLNSLVLDPATTLTLDLNSLGILSKFKGESPYGFSAYSQNQATFTVINFSSVQSDIFDTRNGDVYTLSSGVWTVDPVRDIWSEIGIGRFGFNSSTGKTYYIPDGNTVVKIADVGTNLTVAGNVTANGFKSDNFYYANGTAISFAGTYANANVANYLPTYTGNFQAGNISVTGTYTGNGSGISAINASNITSGTLDQARLANSSITINGIAVALGSSTTITANGSQTLTRGSYLTGNNYNGGTATTWAVDATSTNTADKVVARDTNGSFSANIITASLNGTATTAGTVITGAQPNITSVGTLSSVSVTGNTITGGIKTDGYYYANGAAVSFDGTYANSNVANYLPTYNGNVGAGSATFYGTTLTTGANSIAGTVTGNWTLSAGSRWNATYADLAEWYCADQSYEPGTVLMFGGEKEVTIADIETHRVAGVVSTEPAYVMNSDYSCLETGVVLALQGRVPVKVTGIVEKGDMMVSAGNGYAMACSSPRIGSVIGKSLENFSGVSGVIEVVVGRL